MTKEEKIAEAYGDFWDSLHISARKCALAHDGWIGQLFAHAPAELDLEFRNMSYRPKSLEGIEHNNGWTKMKDREDFPSIRRNSKFDLGVMNTNGVFTVARRCVGSTTLIRGFYHHGITHYREVVDIHPIY